MSNASLKSNKAMPILQQMQEDNIQCGSMAVPQAPSLQSQGQHTPQSQAQGQTQVQQWSEASFNPQVLQGQ